jgi:hypothetical protein
MSTDGGWEARHTMWSSSRRHDEGHRRSHGRETRTAVVDGTSSERTQRKKDSLIRRPSDLAPTTGL